MRMLLTGQGISNDLIRATLLDLLGKPLAESRVVIVIDAILPFPGDRTKLVENLTETHSLGWAEFDVLSLFAGPPSLVESRLRSADVIVGYGGSNHWLAHAWTATGLAPVLRELLDEKVYVGWSAGSMIFSRLHEAAVEALDDQDEVEMFRLDSVGPALPLFDWFVILHLGADWGSGVGRGAWDDGWAAGVAARLGGPVWFVDDDSALLIRDPAADPEVVSNSHWLRFNVGGQLIASH